MVIIILYLTNNTIFLTFNAQKVNVIWNIN